MPARGVVRGQKVDPAKVERAKELRGRGTAEERTLWRHLRANRLHGCHFRRQQIIDGFIVDFYCHRAGLVVEVDGDHHRRWVEHDTERDAILAARGLRVLRIQNREVRENLESVLERIAVACGEET